MSDEGRGLVRDDFDRDDPDAPIGFLDRIRVEDSYAAMPSLTQPTYIDCGTIRTVEDVLAIAPGFIADSADPAKNPGVNVEIVELLLDFARRITGQMEAATFGEAPVVEQDADG